MIRKFNYTGRKKISHDSVQITIYQNNGTKNFSIIIDSLEDVFPDSSEVYLEAYFKTLTKRFHLGKIGDLNEPTDSSLEEFRYNDVIFFRVKIVDERYTIGRIIGLADKIRPTNQKKIPKNKISILYVNYVSNLGQRLFSMDFDEEDLPILNVNKKLKNCSELIRSDIFISTIYPSVIKDIASEIINCNFSMEDDIWQGYWLQYFSETLGIKRKRPDPESDENEKNEWIEEVVNSFCNMEKVRNRFNSIQP